MLYKVTRAGKRKMSDPIDRFEWSGGHPALDLVNTLDERPSTSPVEHLATYRDLVTFVELVGLVEPSIAERLQRIDGRARTLVLGRARKLREHLHEVLLAAHLGRPARAADLDAISAAIRAAHAARVLVASPSPGFARHRWSRPSAIDIPLHACSLVIERLLVDVDRNKIRKCGASDCAVYFVDASRSRRRQWCSMKNCGNREKQRRWRSAR
jgi:predicted RNA-binding Zn ribbon-like protein